MVLKKQQPFLGSKRVQQKDLLELAESDSIEVKLPRLEIGQISGDLTSKHVVFIERIMEFSP
jgi:hypothetical protein